MTDMDIEMLPEVDVVELDNGFRALLVERSSLPVVASVLWYQVGSRDEHTGETGVSHFLEHMMFKGTQRRSAADVNRELDELGGQSNAYTSEEQTVYYATVLPKFQDRLIDLLTDMLSPTLDEDEFATERQVILEEIAKYEDQPPFGAFERAMEVHFGPRGLGRRIEFCRARHGGPAPRQSFRRCGPRDDNRHRRQRRRQGADGA